MASSVRMRFKSISTTSTRRPYESNSTPTGLTEASSVRQEMKCVRQLVGAVGGYVYSATVSAARLPVDYTARVMSHHDGVAIPLEDARILWQR